MLPLWLLASSIASYASAGPHSLPEDPYAFPKYRISFLNGFPVLNDTAEKWLRDGLRGGEAEFLDQPWTETSWDASRQIKEIGSGLDDSSVAAPSPYSLELMRLGPKNSYLCFIPPPPENMELPPPEETAEVNALHSWSLLQPLTGSCIYHRQGWFTYAYCHNSHVRQFREAIRPRIDAPGGYQIEEDADWEAYDLGRAPTVTEGVATADVAVAEQAALAANVELARGIGSRYLVQRWRDGTICDKTGRRREVEVQFHCSMTMTDTILFVKETKTCSYVLVINTPRLCGEPGFKSRVDQREEAAVRCRQVVDASSLAAANAQLPEADSPIQVTRPKSVLPPPGAQAPPADKEKLEKFADEATDSMSQAIQQALQRMFRRAGFDGPVDDVPGTVIVEDVGDGEMLIEFVSDIEFDDGLDLDIEYDVPDEDGDPVLPDAERVVKALRAAGFDVRGEKNSAKEKRDDEKGTKKGAKKDTKDKNRIAWPGQGPRVEL